MNVPNYITNNQELYNKVLFIDKKIKEIDEEKKI